MYINSNFAIFENYMNYFTSEENEKVVIFFLNMCLDIDGFMSKLYNSI